MGIQVQWLDDDERILHYQFTDPWTLEDWYAVLDKGHKMGTARSYTTYTVFDFRRANNIPPGLLSAMGYMRQKAQPNVSLRVVVGAARVIAVFAEVITRAIPQLKGTVHFADTLDEALALIDADSSKQAD